MSRPTAQKNKAGNSRPCFLRIISSDIATLDAFILGNQAPAVPTSNCYRMYIEAYQQVVHRVPYFAYLPDIHTYLARNACVYTFVLASCSLNDFCKSTALLWSKSLIFFTGSVDDSTFNTIFQEPSDCASYINSECVISHIEGVLDLV